MNLLSKEFAGAIKQIIDEKGISKKDIKETLEAALAAAYRKDYGEKGDRIKIELNLKTGSMKVFKVFRIVPDDVPDEDLTEKKEIREKDAKKILKKDKKVKKIEAEKFEAQENRPAEVLVDKDEEEQEEESRNIETLGYLYLPQPSPDQKGFGRIAAQTAKQVIMQRLREAERGALYDVYKEKEGVLINGIVQRKEGEMIFIDLGQTTGILLPENQIPHEEYNLGARLKVYIEKVEQTSKGPEIVLSRTSPEIVRELFKLEVPEISAGKLEVVSIAREPGSRSKIAVQSKEKKLDPIGACIGQRGARVSAVISELGGEKIDIVQYSKNPEIYIANALAPAKIKELRILDKEKQEAEALVAEDQLSLAIGKGGQNVRLAVRLTGWKVDVKPISSAKTETDKKAVSKPKKESQKKKKKT